MTRSDTFDEFNFTEDTQKGKYLTFYVENEVYGIEIHYVTEIIGVQPFTEVPEFPPHFRGIINLRGRIVPVMDIRLRFKKDFREYDNRTCIVIIDTDSMSVGLIVDSVSEVITIEDEDIVPPPDLNSASPRYLKAIGKVDDSVKLLIDCERLLSDEDLVAVVDLVN